jgi:hypothetical protein
MGCCYSEPDGSDCGLAQIDTATAYHEIKPTVIPTYTNTIRKPSVRLPPVAEEEVMVGQAPALALALAQAKALALVRAPTPTPTPIAQALTPIMRAEETFSRPDSDLQSLISPIRTSTQPQPLKKKKGKK